MRLGSRALIVGWSVVAVVAVTGCIPGPAGPAVQSPSQPASCPYDEHAVQANGDSVGYAYSARLRLPSPYSLFNAAQGASSWTISTQVPTIAARVRQWITLCGNPAAVVIEGGVIDVTRTMPIEDVTAEVAALSDWLEERGVPTLWVAVNPFPHVSPYMAKDDRRRAYNEWLTTPGNVWGDTVDCTTALEDPARPGTLAPQFWSIIDLLGNPDGVHPNVAGYEAMASCVRPVLLDVLARNAPAEPGT
jgi:lysophospholipase L1-like esterase